MLFTAWVVEPLSRKRDFVLWGHIGTGLLYGVVALLVRAAEPLGSSVVQVAYLAGIAIFFLALGFLLPAWFALLGDLIPEGNRGRVLGFMFVLNRAGGWVGGEAAHRVLAAPWAPVDQWSTLFLLAMGAAVLGSLPFVFVSEIPMKRPPRETLGRYLRRFLTSLRGLPGLRRFVIADLLAVSGVVVVTHYGDVAIRRHGIDAAWAGRWTSATSLAQLAAALAVMALGHRLRPRHGLTVATACVGAGAVLAAFVESPYAFAVVAALCGSFLTLRMTCHSPQVMRLTRGRDPTGPIGLAMALSAAVGGIGPFLAGWAIPALGFPSVFLAVAALVGAAILLLLAWVPDACASSGNAATE
jgi:hypothetical protein